MLKTLREAFSFIKDFSEEEVPGAKKRECGNYLSHDLCGAKKLACDYYEVIKSLTPKDLSYPE